MLEELVSSYSINTQSSEMGAAHCTLSGLTATSLLYSDNYLLSLILSFVNFVLYEVRQVSYFNAAIILCDDKGCRLSLGCS